MNESHASALKPFLDHAAAMTPAGAEIIDAHTHLGLDEDGRSLTLEQLLQQLDSAGARRACVFPLHDPDREPAYRVPNDRVLAWAAQSEGRLVPFCRLDPAQDPIEEGERALSAGARGIKLHPRAQAFALRGEGIDAIFKLAGRHRVPILVHAGRGMPPIADDLAEVALSNPEVVLILAHCAIADQGVMTSLLADHPNILYDTSTWSPFDLSELFARVPAERIVFASDPPYGHPATGLYMALSVAHAIGLDERRTELFVGGTMASLIDRGELPPRTEPVGRSTMTMPGTMLRLFGYTIMAGPALYGGHPEVARISLDLALSVCRDPAAGELRETLETLESGLTAALELLDEIEPDDPATVRPAIDLVSRCQTLAATAHLRPERAAAA